MSITSGSSLCSRTLDCPAFSAASCEVFTATASLTWNSWKRTEDNSLWPEVYDRVVQRVVSFFAVAFDPIFRWLQESTIPRHPDNLEFLQHAQCAYADDFAVASFSFRGLMTALAPAIRSVDSIAGLKLNHRQCCWVQCGTEERDSLRTCISENCEEFREMQIVRHAKYVGT